ncbi:MAG TPA: hypothetical protein VNH83_24045 [Bryobacteraceae bacterium]|nr:hypothetical protein [Bryobacteraceae bacterium]
MDSVPQDRVPVETHEASDIAELLRLIRAGHAGATRRLHRFLTPGVSFLLRRRLGRNDVAHEAQSLLEAATRIIQTDISLLPAGMPRLLRRLIQERCAGQTNAAAETGAVAVRPASGSAITGLSLVEREALRRCYVLGEAPESFLETLKLTAQEFRSIRARARVEFSSRKAKNVA